MYPRLCTCVPCVPIPVYHVYPHLCTCVQCVPIPVYPVYQYLCTPCNHTCGHTLTSKLCPLSAFFISVAMRDVEECHRFDRLNLTSSSGWISSYVSLATGCGSTEHPWVIQVRPGQRVNLTVYDFSLDRAYNSNTMNLGAGTEVCQEYALVQDWASAHSTIVCGGRSKEQHVLTSDSNVLEIKLTNNNDKYFLVKYEGGYNFGSILLDG